MSYLNQPTKDDLVEDTMDRLKAISNAEVEDAQRLVLIREGFRRMTMTQLDALWWMLDPDQRRP